MNFRMNHGIAIGFALALGTGAMLLLSEDAGEPAPRAPHRVAADDATAGEPAVAAGQPVTRDVAQVEPRSGFYGAPVGQCMHYDFTAATTLALQSDQAAGSSEVRIELSGAMAVTVLARREQELIARVCLDKIAGATRQGTNEFALRDGDPLTVSLAAPTLVRMGDDGRVLGYAFASATQPDHRNWLRGIWSSLRCVARADAAWTVREDDVVGNAETSHRWQDQPGEPVTGGTIVRTKRGYDALASHATATVVGDGTFSLSGNLGWIEQADWHETTRATIDEVDMTTMTTFTASCRLRDVTWTTDDLEADWNLDWQPVGGSHERAASGADAEAARYRERLSGVSVDALCADLAAMVAAGAIDTPEGYGRKLDLTWLLKLQPDTLLRAQRLLPTLSPEVAGLLLSAMGATELPAAQQFLTTLFADGGQPAALRQAAAWAMVQVREPSGAAVQGFAGALADAGAFDAGVAAGVLALGTMTGRVAAAAQPAAVAQLLALEEPSVRNGALANWLEALGNSGRPEALSAAQRHAGADDPMVRASAVSAVRAVAGDVALQRIVQGLADAEPFVRARAVEVLAERTEPAAREHLTRAFATETDERVRDAIAAVLGR